MKKQDRRSTKKQRYFNLTGLVYIRIAITQGKELAKRFKGFKEILEEDLPYNFEEWAIVHSSNTANGRVWVKEQPCQTS